MDIRRETRLGLSVLLIVQVLLCMLSIALLMRMGPAVQRILEDNVYSVEAVEDMAAIFALSHEPTSTPAAYTDALRRVRDNITEDAEVPLVEQLEARSADAFAGDPEARDAVVNALRKLGEVNRLSMQRADEEAQRLGRAGAWAAVVLGAASLAIGIGVYRRLRIRLELPLEHLRRTMHAVRTGNHRARAGAVEGPAELVELAENIDWTLDHSEQQRRPVTGGTPSPDRDAAFRRALRWTSDRAQLQVLLVDEADKLAFGDLDVFAEYAADDSNWERAPLEHTDLSLLWRPRQG
ncbi:MAG: hypothetical protein ACE37F_09190 [Nannocystaceae bacterium]|nr:hypothetical protein [bacterium]